MKSLTTMRSRALDRTGVMEIGRLDRSAGLCGISRMDAAFHCRGTTDDASDKLNMSDSGAVRKGARILKTRLESCPDLSTSDVTCQEHQIVSIQ